jgi:hypothetical protein
LEELMRRRVGYPFIALGISFMVIGFSGRRAFIGIGLAFLVLGFVTLRTESNLSKCPIRL